MNKFGGDNPGFSSLKERRALPFDFHHYVSFEDAEQFLGSRMHVPGSSSAGPEFDDADDGLLDQLTLILQVFSQDLGQLRPCLGLRWRELRHGWHGDCDPGEKEEFAPDNLHDSLP